MFHIFFLTSLIRWVQKYLFQTTLLKRGDVFTVTNFKTDEGSEKTIEGNVLFLLTPNCGQLIWMPLILCVMESYQSKYLESHHLHTTISLITDCIFNGSFLSFLKSKHWQSTDCTGLSYGVSFFTIVWVSCDRPTISELLSHKHRIRWYGSIINKKKDFWVTHK